MDNLVVVRGGGDIATGVIHKLKRCGFNIVILEIDNPTSVRRNVSFCEAIYEGEMVVEGIKSVFVDSIDEIHKEISKNNIPIIVDKEGRYIELLKPRILVDATISKKNIGLNKNMADIVIGIGPGIEAGIDVDYVIESSRGHDLARVIFNGYAKPNTKIPGEVMGYTVERVLRSPSKGIISNKFELGSLVNKGDVIAIVNEKPIYAEISGVLRGLIRDGIMVKENMKIGDIDPRGVQKYTNTISDKARAIAGGVLEAILIGIREEEV